VIPELQVPISIRILEMTNIAMFWLAACNIAAKIVRAAATAIAFLRPIASATYPKKNPATQPPSHTDDVLRARVVVVRLK
jgi:hypothetical protein